MGQLRLWQSAKGTMYGNFGALVGAKIEALSGREFSIDVELGRDTAGKLPLSPETAE